MLKVKNTDGGRPFGGEAAKPDLVLHVLRLVLHVLCPSRFIVPPLPTSYRLPVKERSDWSSVAEVRRGRLPKVNRRHRRYGEATPKS